MARFDVLQVFFHLLSLGIAFMLALPVGWDREQQERSAGLRTFSLVAVASCGYILLAERVAVGRTDAQARVIEGLITGIGFIGGGAILKEGGTVRFVPSSGWASACAVPSSTPTVRLTPVPLARRAFAMAYAPICRKTDVHARNLRVGVRACLMRMSTSNGLWRHAPLPGLIRSSAYSFALSAKMYSF